MKDYLEMNYWVSKEAIEAAYKAHENGKKCCRVCKKDKAPGYMVNANQWINCPHCNPTKGNNGR